MTFLSLVSMASWLIFLRSSSIGFGFARLINVQDRWDHMQQEQDRQYHASGVLRGCLQRGRTNTILLTGHEKPFITTVFNFCKINIYTCGTFIEKKTIFWVSSLRIPTVLEIQSSKTISGNWFLLDWHIFNSLIQSILFISP